MAKEDESAKEFSNAVRAFEKASRELGQSTGKEVAGIIGKDLMKVTDPFVKSFNQIPGVQTLGNVGKTLFNKGFAALKDKREKQLLADRLGLTKKEFQIAEQAKRSNDAFKEMNKKMMDAAQNLLGLDPSYLEKMNERDEQGRFKSTKEMVAAIDANREALLEEARQNNILNEGRINMAKKAQGNRAKQEELEAEQAASEKKNQSLLESMVNGITILNKSFLLGLKDKGKFALAGLAALIAAPVVTLVNFFKSLSVEFAFLTKLVKGGFKIVTAPLRFIGRMFNSLIQLNKAAGAGPVQKAILGIEKLGKTVFSPFQKIGNFLQTVKSSGLDKVSNLLSKAKPALTAVKNFLAPVGKFFSTIFGLGKTLVSASQSASGILKFASGLGSILGKIFLPITILMSAFDFVTGFMEGYKKDGIIGGLREGVAKLFGNLIGAPLDLLKSGVAWVLKQFGFDESSEALKKFSFKDLIMDIVRAPFRLVEKIVDIIQNFDFKSLIPNNKFTRFLGLVDDKKGESLDAQIKKREKELVSLKEDADKKSWYESSKGQAEDIERYAMAQRELDRLKAELAAQRAAGGGTNVNASTTVNDARQSKTTNVTGAPIVDTSAAGAIAAAN